MPTTTSVRRTILFFLFLTVLVTVWPSSAAGAQRRESFLSAPAAELAVTEFFGRLWALLQGRPQGKDGCHIDPDGRCAPIQRPEPLRKDGCHIDPNGRCNP